MSRLQRLQSLLVDTLLSCASEPLLVLSPYASTRVPLPYQNGYLTVELANGMIRLERTVHLHECVAIIDEDLAHDTVLAEERPNVLLVAVLREVTDVELGHHDHARKCKRQGRVTAILVRVILVLGGLKEKQM